MTGHSDDSKSEENGFAFLQAESADKIPQGRYEIAEEEELIPPDQWSLLDELYQKKDIASQKKEEQENSGSPLRPEKDQEKGPVENRAPEKKEEIFISRPSDKSAEGAKACPSCGARIQKDAVKCKYCGEIVQQPARRKILL
jgi:hypothetical protein